MALARLKLLKSAALLNDSGSSNDTLYGALLIAASKAVENYCGRTLESATLTAERYTGDNRTILYLRQWPVTAVSSVSIWDSSSASFVVENANYYELMDSLYLRYPKLGQESNATYSCWPYGEDENIKITYTAGYTTTNWTTATYDTTQLGTVPTDLELAVALVAERAYRNLGGIASETQGPRSIVYTTNTAVQGAMDGMPPHIIGMLAPYRRVAFV